jgi:hypothetical protein
MPKVLVVMTGLRCYYAHNLDRHVLPAFLAKACKAIVSQVYSLSFLYYDDAPLPLHIFRRIWSDC